MQNLPQPSLDAQNHSQALEQHIQKICQQAGGAIPFKQFMELALYAPGLGYYSAGSCKFGAQGDFVTAPEISPLFGQSLSFALNSILESFSKGQMPSILELGAGTGKLAADILENLETLPQKYYILEVSADLIERQKSYLAQRLSSALFERIEWLHRLPSKPFAGIILANEVLDAMPVHKIQLNPQSLGPHQEYYVKYEDTQFQWHLGEPSTLELNKTLTKRFGHIKHPLTSEINTDLKPWLQGLSNCLTQGVMIFIDYGFPEHEYYHLDRNMGTLMCHYRHRAHNDVFQYIGLSDITAHVDFSALAHTAHSIGLTVAGFTTQAGYLLDNNLMTYAKQSFDKALESEVYALSQQIQQLVQPQEMGELFKVMALSKAWETPLSGFDLQDHLSRL